MVTELLLLFVTNNSWASTAFVPVTITLARTIRAAKQPRIPSCGAAWRNEPMLSLPSTAVVRRDVRHGWPATVGGDGDAADRHTAPAATSERWRGNLARPAWRRRAP